MYETQQSSRSDDRIPVEAAIAGDISNGPDSLLNDSRAARIQQTYKQRDTSLVDDGLALQVCP